MRDTETVRDTEGEAGFVQRARCRTRSQDPGVMPRTKGRRSAAKPLRCPEFLCSMLKYFLHTVPKDEAKGL